MKWSARKWPVWELVAAISVVAVVAAILVVINSDGRQVPGTAVPAPPTSTAPSPSQWRVPYLAVKIDNVAAARPQTGLGSADVVYVEPVEGGLTRLVALYARGDVPAAIGPVRSARRTDVELLAQYGTPVLAYSGAAPELLPTLRAARVINASPAQAAAAFFRSGDRRAPHNLFVRPAALPDKAKAPRQAPLLTGSAPAGGTSVTQGTVGYPAARYVIAWSTRHQRWVITMDGTPMLSTECGPLTAATVVIQTVRVTAREGIEDARGNPSPVARTVGTGKAVVFRDGKRYAATWSRPTALSPTRLRTARGAALPVGTGPVWVFLTRP
ncbi:MAG TPA: DUF3048 domain-containing protein [Actinophytocola sp.]|jgi:hypothetical protein|uniref:DUF3048 domain-containing protein n=1 Tax=Actinophytocola sp. TaxID=1872138 RepID=UPI002F91E282